MTGQIIPENTTEFVDEAGELGGFVDLAEANFAIMRLATQQATDDECLERAQILSK